MGGSAVVSLKLPLGHVSVLEVVNNFIPLRVFEEGIRLGMEFAPSCPTSQALTSGEEALE